MSLFQSDISWKRKKKSAKQKKIEYNYFNSGAIVETEDGTYADREAEISQECIVWNHSMSDVVNSLIKNGLHIDLLEEYDYSPYNCFKNTIEIEPKKYERVDLEMRFSAFVDQHEKLCNLVSSSFLFIYLMSQTI